MSVTRFQHVPAHFAQDLDPAYVEAGNPPPTLAPGHRSPGPLPLPQVHDGATLYTAGGDSIQHGGTAKHVHSDAGQTGGSIAATLGRRGAAATVEVIPGRPESRTDVRAAERMGLIRWDGNAWVDVDGMADAVAKVDAPPPADDFTPAESPAFDPAEDQAFNEAIAGIEQSAFESTMAGTIAALASGKGLEGVAQRLASSSGIEPQQASELITQAIGYYQSAAARALEGIGMSEQAQDQFFGSLNANPSKLTEVMQALAFQRDASPLLREAGAWRGSNPPDLSAFHEAGFETHVDRRTGEVLLRKAQDGAGWQKLSDLQKANTKLAPAAQAPAAPKAQQQAAQASPAFKASDWAEVGDLTATQRASYEANGYQVLHSGRITYVRKL